MTTRGNNIDVNKDSELFGALSHALKGVLIPTLTQFKISLHSLKLEHFKSPNFQLFSVSIFILFFLLSVDDRQKCRKVYFFR